MRAPGRAEAQDTDTDHGRLYLAMAEKFLDRVDIVAPSSERVADKCPLWVLAVSKLLRSTFGSKINSGRPIMTHQ